MPRLRPSPFRVTRLLRHAVALAVLAACAHGSAARAQEPEGERAHKNAARELFAEGIELADAERWAEAEDRFRRALAFRDSAVIAFNLASVLAKQSELTEASELLHGVLRASDTPASVRDPAQTLLTEIEPRLSKLTIEVHGAASGDTVALDGRELREAELGVALPVDPGVHSLVALRDGERLTSDSVRIDEGRSERIVLDLPPVEGIDLTPTPVAAASATSEPVDEPWNEPVDEDESGDASWLLWTGVGVAAVGIAVVAVVLATGSSKTKTQEPFAGDFSPSSLRVVVAP